MSEYYSIRTYRDLLEALQAASEEQLSMPVQCVDSHPVDEYVHALKKAICLGTVDALDLRYTRSVVDNRRHGDELVLFCDGNPFGEDGASAYTMKEQSGESGEDALTNFRDRMEPIYPDDHDESRDWTGPAQIIADQTPRNRGQGTVAETLASRIEKNESQ